MQIEDMQQSDQIPVRTTRTPDLQSQQTVLPPSFWRGMMLVALLLGVAWINYSRLPAEFESHTSTMQSSLPGLLLGIGVFLFMLHCVRIPAWTILDTVTLMVIGSWIALALWQFIHGERYGLPTDLPWATELWGERRHPVQMYEAVTLFILLLVLWRMTPTALPGEIFWYGMLYVGTTELVLEAFRSESDTTMAGIRVLQLVALAVVLTALYEISLYARQQQ